MNRDELNRYRDRLVATRADLVDELRRMGEAVSEDVRAPGDISDDPTHPADRDSEGIQTKIALERTEGEILNQVNRALDRIEQGTFGQCEDCAAEIPRERLDAIPHTPCCVRCEERREREAREQR